MPTAIAADTPPLTPAERKHLWRKIGLGFAILLAAALIGARLYLPVWATGYVNRTLENIPGYTGSISDVDIHLYRGAYTIHDLKLFKKSKGIPVPFLDFKSSDLSIQWGALLDGLCRWTCRLR